jgi:hypothetical protein
LSSLAQSQRPFQPFLDPLSFWWGFLTEYFFN